MRFVWTVFLGVAVYCSGQLPAVEARPQDPSAQDPSARDATRAAMEELLAAGGDPTLRIELVVRGEAALGSVPFGEPFVVDVIRRWPVGEEAEPWSDGVLAPLTVEQLSVERGTEQNQIVETRSFRAHSFRLGAVTLRPEFGIVVPEGNEPRRGVAELTTLLVDSGLPEGDDGELERPPAPPLWIEPVRRIVFGAAGLALGAGGLAWLLRWLWTGWRASQAPRVSRERTPAERIAALAAVSERELGAYGREAWRADAVEWSSILDDLHSAAAEAPSLVEMPTAELADLGEHLDQVKFAGGTLGFARRAELLEDTARLERGIAEARARQEAGS